MTVPDASDLSGLPARWPDLARGAFTTPCYPLPLVA
jgi:hypothetical protein